MQFAWKNIFYYNKSMKILVVEDDIHISGMLCELLSRHGYEPVPAFSGSECMLLLRDGGFSLVLLDLMLPGKTGEEVLREMRAAAVNTPVIVLTAVTDKPTTVQLLAAGADDYLAKPFDTGELLARIAVQLRRGVADALHYGDITLDTDAFDAIVNGKNAGLSKREYEILRLLMRHPQKVFTKQNIYESVWGGGFLGDDNTVGVHISHLRAKLAGDYIKTIWGIGYKMG
jgi:DNA-binding response OmpR family regulator